MSSDEGKDVAQILSEGKYDLPMFLRYLKTFAVDGVHPDKAILLAILMQSLARFHTSDFTACMCLVPSHVQDSSSVEKELSYIYELENLLSCGAFPKFWAQWSIVKEHLPESFNFETRVRASILETISHTMEKISISRIALNLAVPAEHVKKTIENVKIQGGEFELISCDGEYAVFARNVFNYPETKVNQDAIKFPDIVTIIQ